MSCLRTPHEGDSPIFLFKFGGVWVDCEAVLALKALRRCGEEEDDGGAVVLLLRQA
jgi:hypothetical protein